MISPQRPDIERRIDDTGVDEGWVYPGLVGGVVEWKILIVRHPQEVGHLHDDDCKQIRPTPRRRAIGRIHGKRI
jgi:hypothetical protein